MNNPLMRHLGAIVGLLLCCGLAACGATHHTVASGSADASGPLKAFQLPVAGTKAAITGPDWQQYGARPLNRTLTINAVSVYDAGSMPLTLVAIRQLHPIRGLVFHSQLVSLTPGFGGFSEYVSASVPEKAFGLGANFSPLRGFLVNPDPKAQMTGFSPALVLTATATRTGMFHIGDWVITYRVGTVRHTLTLVDDGQFCVGRTGCPTI